MIALSTISKSMATVPLPARLSAKPAGSAKKRYYRRSVTTKAPRKRTFICHMVKLSEKNLLGFPLMGKQVPQLPECTQNTILAQTCRGEAIILPSEMSGGGNCGNGRASIPRTSYSDDGDRGFPFPISAFCQNVLILSSIVAFAQFLIVGEVLPAHARIEQAAVELPDMNAPKLVFGKVHLTPSEMRFIRDDQYRIREYYRV